MSTRPATASLDRVGRSIASLLRSLRAAAPWRAAAFLLLSLPIGAVWFALLVVLLPIGAALALLLRAAVLLILALPVLLAALVRRRRPRLPRRWRAAGVSGLAVPLGPSVAGARFERARVRRFLGESIPSPDRPPPAGGALRRARALAADPAVWRDLTYLLLLFPVAVAQFVITVVVIALPLALIILPLFAWSLPNDGVGIDFIGAIGTLPEAVLVALLGLALVVPACLILLWAARDHVALAHRLLGRSSEEQLRERVDQLTRTRSATIEAQLEERRRIERDLHDGAQQRLVALAMDLGLAREKLRTDPEAAGALVERSHEEAKRVLAELRDLVRGIHPAVLADRGLDAAISSVAARSPIPVTVDVALATRPPEPVEAAAYFVVVEALTNVAKHAGATESRVAVRREGDRLLVEVVDDGNGGADPSNGTGLGGLRDRIAALDGVLLVESPPGGPTRVAAEIPWL